MHTQNKEKTSSLITNRDSEQLSTSYIFSFWYPLALTWAMMALEGPILNAIVAHLPNQKINLAAYGIATNLAMLIESPVIMILSATIALVSNKQSYSMMRKYMHSLNFIVTIAMLIALVPFIFDVIAYQLLKLEPNVADLAYKGITCMVLWPLAIGYRRFYQGLIISSGRTRLVAFGTIFRLSGIVIGGYILTAYTQLEGVIVGTATLTFAVVCEAIATRIMARNVVKQYQSNFITSTSNDITFRSITTFYIPLALTSVLGMAVTPMLTFFIGQSRMVLESLATLSSIDSFVFQFRSPGFSYQEVALALLGFQNKHIQKIRVFGLWILVITTSLLMLISFTPIVSVIYTEIYGLTDELASFAILPTQILSILPALSVLYSLQRAVLINSRSTREVTISTLIEVGCIAIAMIVQLMMFKPVGAIAVAVSTIVGRVIANIYLWFHYRRILTKG